MFEKMLVKKTDTKKISNSANCTVWEYDTKTIKFNMATVFIDGRFPDEKKMVNLELEEMYYVQSGEAIIYTKGNEIKIEKGDVYLFAKGEKFWVEAKKLKLVVFCVPAFDPKQHKIVD